MGPLPKKHDPDYKKKATDKQIWEEIEKDVKRTRQDVAFFHMAINSDCKDSERLLRQAQTKKGELSKDDIENYVESHSDAIARILFMYAKLNPGIRYV